MCVCVCVCVCVCMYVRNMLVCQCRCGCVGVCVWIKPASMELFIYRVYSIPLYYFLTWDTITIIVFIYLLNLRASE